MPQEMNSLLPVLSEEKETLFNQLLAAKRPSDVSAKTDEEYYIRDLVVSISKAVTMPGKDDISEMEHTMRNIVPFLDATIGCDQECRVHYGEQTLEPTAVRRNEGSDPNERARAGYKVDVIVEYQDLNWLPVIGCGRKLRIYALAAVRELFHLVLVEEISLPSSRRDLVNTKHVYLAMSSFNEKVQGTKRRMDVLNQARVATIRKRERTPEQEPRRPEIIVTPTINDNVAFPKATKKARYLPNIMGSPT
ncbi:hypothetical protein BC937DRAFT_93933 [Endogone sp. FLAS-F59071]|nr:hypothetical protein BC937DRAFT_93933 [Endogone sp. FLAS-F59071]|eukprot:RUS14361.1 hypothetical protein BC937DRAFT_93933 [Endogone sp. FLAS-F59071]